MNKRKNDGEINEESQQQKLNDADPNEIAGVNVLNQESPPAIFKLNAICCDDLFEWLSLEDLHSLGQTCKRMHRLCGLYFQENYKEALTIDDQNIDYLGCELNGFISFARSLKLDDDSADFRYIGENCDSLHQIIFEDDTSLTKALIDCIKINLDKIETIDYFGYDMKPLSIRFYEDFLKFCPNLKIFYVKHISSHDNEWMRHKYPKLEHFSLTFSPESLGQNLELFCQRNAHLKSFETCSFSFVKNSDTFINCKSKLELFTVLYVTRDHLDDTCTLLNAIYHNGFYKRLGLRVTDSKMQQAEIDRIGTLSGLENLSITSFEENIVIPMIASLKVLQIDNWGMFNIMEMDNIDLKTMTVSFPNLRRVHLRRASIYQLIPLIRRLPKLKALRIDNFCPSDESIDLPALNKKRKKLFGACKVTIYVEEDIYLETKMATKNLYAEHNLIEIKRCDSDKLVKEF